MANGRTVQLYRNFENDPDYALSNIARVPESLQDVTTLVLLGQVLVALAFEIAYIPLGWQLCVLAPPRGEGRR